MEKKKISWRDFALWSFSVLRGIYSSFLGRGYASKSGAGFTLVELLIVMALVAVLIGGLITLINPVTQLQKARDATRKSDLSQIQAALELYRSDLGVYPSSLPGCGLALTGGGPPPNTYMTKVPCDPSTPPTVYLYSTNTPAPFVRYCLRACLENTSDQGKDSTNNFACETVAGCPGGTVSYTARNP